MVAETEERKVSEGNQLAHIYGCWNRRKEGSRRRPAGPHWWSLKQMRGRFQKATNWPTLMVAETDEGKVSEGDQLAHIDGRWNRRGEGFRRRPTGPHWWSLKQKRGWFQKVISWPTLMLAETDEGKVSEGDQLAPTLMVAETDEEKVSEGDQLAHIDGHWNRREEGSRRRPTGPHWWSLKQTRRRFQKATNWPTLMVAETDEEKVSEGDQLAHIDGHWNRREECSRRWPADPHWWSLKQKKGRFQKAISWPTLMVAETEERKVPEVDQLAHIGGRWNRREEGSRRRSADPHWWSLKQKMGRFQKAISWPTLGVFDWAVSWSTLKSWSTFRIRLVLHEISWSTKDVSRNSGDIFREVNHVMALLRQLRRCSSRQVLQILINSK